MLAHQLEPDSLQILATLAVVDGKVHTNFISRIVVLLVEHDLRVALGRKTAAEAANFALEISCDRFWRLL